MSFVISMYAGRLLLDLPSRVMPALAQTAARIQNGTADAAIVRWFGVADQAEKKLLASVFLKLRSNLNIRSITLGFEDLQRRDKDTNAAAWPAGRGMNIGDAMAHVPKGESAITLDLAFSRLPIYLPRSGGQIDVSQDHQSKFETLVHELTHLILGTQDEKLASGEEAYGTKSAFELVGEGNGAGIANAENWGIFVEAVGIHGCS